MGAAGKVVPHQSILRPKGLGIHLVQHIPAPVAVAIACAGGKAALADPGLLKGGKHLLLVPPLGRFNFLKLGRGTLAGPFGRLGKSGVQIEVREIFHDSIILSMSV